MYGGANFNFANDRFNKPLSAISLQTGYLNIPASDFFGTGKFTIMAWVNVRNYNTWSRLVDFGLSGMNKYDNIAVALSLSNTGMPTFEIRIGTVKEVGKIQPTKMLSLGVWEHLACTVDYPNGYTYINGNIEIRSISNFNFTTEIRDSNFLGRSWNYPLDADADADIDDLKIFNRALSQQEILDEMNS